MATVEVEKKVLARNDLVAEKNREKWKAGGAFSINLISSPGAGKTTLLEKTLIALAGRVTVAVIEGDVATENDADRIRAVGVPAEAVVTGGACHLDASMTARAYSSLEKRLSSPPALLVIENVGNLVCPAAYDLGEDEKVVLLSVTEGEDKPLKYPAVFAAAQVCVVTKADLLPHLDFDFGKMTDSILSINPGIKIFTLSARTGEGMDAWVEYLAARAGGRAS